jgi:hypothetical protein
MFMRSRRWSVSSASRASFCGPQSLSVFKVYFNGFVLTVILLCFRQFVVYHLMAACGRNAVNDNKMRVESSTFLKRNV